MTSTGPTPVPVAVSGLSNASLTIAAGGSHSLAVKTDRTVVAWGDNGTGELGNGSAASNSSVPVPVSGLSSVSAVAAGPFHSLAVTSDGAVWAWGDDSSGQLGDGPNGPNRSTPLRVPGLPAGLAMTGVAGGHDHSLAVAADGTVWGWGSDYFGQTGQSPGPPTGQAPLAIPGFSGVTAVAAGTFHSLALKADRTVWAWGRNNAGQLGFCPLGICSDRAAPVQVPGLSGVVAIAAGGSHSLAVKADGSVWAWGLNSSGQVGTNNNTDAHAPVQVQMLSGGPLSGIFAVAGGGSHSVAVAVDGTVWAWGANDSGQLGDGTTTQRLGAFQIGGIGGAGAVAAGFSHTIVAQGMPVGGPVSGAERRGGGTGNIPCSDHAKGPPVSTGTGNFWHTFSDLAVPGRGTSLSLDRTFNSSAAAINSPLGFGWSFSYGMTITQTSNTATVTEEGGDTVTFDLVGGSYVPHYSRDAATLTISNGVFTYTRRATEIFAFDAATGRLSSKSAPDHYSTALAYDGSGHLTTVTDPESRSFTFGYTGSHITSVTDTATPPRTVLFGYNDGAGNLTDVTDVTNGHTTFTYNPDHTLKTWRQPKFADVVTYPTQMLTNVYDSTGRVVTQTDQINNQVTTFDYAPVGAPPGRPRSPIQRGTRPWTRTPSAS